MTMTEDEFQNEASRATAMKDLERPSYWTGYARGLERGYRGERFGTVEQHVKMLRLINDPSPTKRERGRGYHDGLERGGE
jgi:hypothetical protein